MFKPVLAVSTVALLVLAVPANGLPPAARPETVRPRRTTPEVLAARPSDGTRLFLAGVVFDPLRERPDFGALGFPRAPEVRRGLAFSRQGGGTVDAPAWGIVQFLPGRAAAARRELEARGVVFAGYLPDNAFRVRLTASALDLLDGNPDVRWLGAWEPGFKVSPRLWPGSTDGAVEVTVYGFPGTRAAGLAKRLAAQFPDAVVTRVQEDALEPRLRVSIPPRGRDDLVLEAAQIPEVSWIEPYEMPRLHNDDSLGPLQSNATSVVANGVCTTCTIFGHGLTGTGQRIAVSDSGLTSDACFFRTWNGTTATTDATDTHPPELGPIFPNRKVVGYFTQPGATAYDNNAGCQGGPNNSFHGTHTTGTAAGDNSATPAGPGIAGIDPGDGMAPDAQIVFQDIGDDVSGCLFGLADNYAMFLQASAAGARISSNSWGGSGQGDYSGDDASLDRFLFDHEEMAIFFSAGNDGHPIPPAISTIGSPASAKNVVTVGALGHGNSLAAASFSSRGPAADGRVKPDIQAPGSQIVSALGNAERGSNRCQTQLLSGTSMSCPTAAGTSVLLRQYFADGFYPTGSAVAADALEPTAPLVKAALLNGALPLPTAGVWGNGDYGWGRVFLDDNLFFAGDARKLRVFSVGNRDGLRSGESRTFVLAVPAGQELRITLVWSDAEANSAAGRALVNDLDLTVAGSGQTYFGNVLSATGESTPGGNPDRTNNVEQFRLTQPAPGAWTITVTAANVPGNGRLSTDRQGYALVASYGACATAVAAPPSSVTAASDPDFGVDLAFTAAPNATVTQIYRATGGCSARPGDFQFVGNSSDNRFRDRRAQGGFLYGYRVRGADGCGEGPSSGCVEIIPEGRCDIAPTFGGLVSAVPDADNCRIHLTWNPAVAGCNAGSGALRYNVYRSTDPGFEPSSATLVATLAGATSYDDTTPSHMGSSVVAARTYFYVVRAEDLARGSSGPHGGNEEPNDVKLFAAASGRPGAHGTYRDGAEDGERSLTGEGPWRVTATDAHAGRFSYHSGPDTGTYPNDTCASLTTPALTLGTSSVLSYQARFKLEYQFDGVVVEISDDGGVTWSDLAPTNPAGYPDALALTGEPPINACGFPASRRAFTGPPPDDDVRTDWTRYETQIPAAFAGKTVRIRWRFTTDPGAEYSGFYLDEIAVSDVALPGSCAPVDLPRAPETGLPGVLPRR